MIRAAKFICAIGVPLAADAAPRTLPAPTLLVSMAMLALAATDVQAGCPATTERVEVEVSSCHFRDARSESDFRKQVEHHLARYGEGRSGAQAAVLLDNILARNTGALLQARTTGGASESYFMGSVDADACDQFAVGQPMWLLRRPTCPMVPFEAPTDWLAEPPSGGAMAAKR